jgi:hypothetical protein
VSIWEDDESPLFEKSYDMLWSNIFFDGVIDSEVFIILRVLETGSVWNKVVFFIESSEEASREKHESHFMYGEEIFFPK